MEMLELLPQPSSLVPLLGALLILLTAYISSLGLSSNQKDPPGPKALPIVGNLLQLDLKNPWKTLMEVRSQRCSESRRRRFTNVLQVSFYCLESSLLHSRL